MAAKPLTRRPRAPSPTPPRRRQASGAVQRSKLSREHFAFLRGWFQGLDERTLWDQYLTQLGAFDTRRCRSFLVDLQTELGAIARRSGDPAVAGLVRRRGARMRSLATPESPSTGSPPSLEEFSQQFDEDMYSQAELTELWREAYANRASGRPRRRDATERRAKLIARQLEALDWLERLACELPQPADSVRAWLDSRVSDRLGLAGVKTLGELMFLVRSHGFRWHERVPRLGSKGAGLLVRWLEKQSATLGALPLTSLFPASRISGPMREQLAPKGVMGIAPLDRVQLPQSLATAAPGAERSNRAPVAQCKIDAANDFAAVRAWLAMWPAGSHTWRAYRREAERFLLWSVFERAKPLSGLEPADCAAYRDFLANPGPEWVGARHVQRWSPQWRPFEGSLSPRSAKTAVTILGSMCEWLARRRYLDTNPWDGVPQSARAPSMPTLRSLTRHQWGLVESWLDGLPDEPRFERLRFLLRFAYRSGLREAELAAATVEWLRCESLEDGQMAWSIMVLGKRNKWREVALPSSAVTSLAESFLARGLDPSLLDNDPKTPLLGSLVPGGSALTPGRIYQLVKAAFSRCAGDIADRDRKAADRIRQASTHWLRHTHGAHAAETMPLEVLQAQLGHESPATTAVYARAEKSRRQREVEKAFG